MAQSGANSTQYIDSNLEREGLDGFSPSTSSTYGTSVLGTATTVEIAIVNSGFGGTRLRDYYYLRYRRYGTVGTVGTMVPTVRERNLLALPTLDMYLPLSNI